MTCVEGSQQPQRLVVRGRDGRRLERQRREGIGLDRGAAHAAVLAQACLAWMQGRQPGAGVGNQGEDQCALLLRRRMALDQGLHPGELLQPILGRRRQEFFRTGDGLGQAAQEHRHDMLAGMLHRAAALAGETHALAAAVDADHLPVDLAMAALDLAFDRVAVDDDVDHLFLAGIAFAARVCALIKLADDIFEGKTHGGRTGTRKPPLSPTAARFVPAPSRPGPKPFAYQKITRSFGSRYILSPGLTSKAS